MKNMNCTCNVCGKQWELVTDNFYSGLTIRDNRFVMNCRNEAGDNSLHTQKEIRDAYKKNRC